MAVINSSVCAVICPRFTVRVLMLVSRIISILLNFNLISPATLPAGCTILIHIDFDYIRPVSS